MSQHVHAHVAMHRLRLAFGLTAILIVVKGVAGWWGHSLALMADAGHSLTDLGAIAISWFALHQVQKPPTETMTFGFYRTEIFAALINGVVLILLAGFVAWTAYVRLGHPTPVDPWMMLWGAGVAIAIDAILVWKLGAAQNVGLRSTALHLIGDLAGSIGVLVAGMMIWLTGRFFWDPVISVGLALLIAWGAWRIVQETVGVLMEASPKGIVVGDVILALESLPEVVRVHDLHIWSLTTGKNALACHVLIDHNPTLDHCQGILGQIQDAVAPWGISHMTVQMEPPGEMRHPEVDW